MYHVYSEIHPLHLLHKHENIKDNQLPLRHLKIVVLQAELMWLAQSQLSS